MLEALPTLDTGQLDEHTKPALAPDPPTREPRPSPSKALALAPQGPWPAMSPHDNGVLADRNPFHDDRGSACGDVLDALCRRLARGLASLFIFLRGNGPRIAVNLASRGVWLLRRNLTRRRVLSFPHLLVLVWIFVLLRGEGWIFHWKVDKCSWDHWEDWVRKAPFPRCLRRPQPAR